jgi:hypothetical protein
MMKKRTILIIFLVILLIFSSSNIIFAQQFQRVQREEVPFTLTFGLSLYYYGSSSFTYYNINPYIYLDIDISETFSIFFNIPAVFIHNKAYVTSYDELFNEIISTNIKYAGGIPYILAGAQFTFYTNSINDIFFYFTYPIGSYPAFYFRSDQDIYISSDNINVSFGYRLTKIADPLLFSITPQIAASYYFPTLFDKEGDFTQSYSIQCKLNLTIVFNNIISTSISITPYFTIPEIREFEGFVDRQLYTYGINGEFGIGIRLSEVTSLGFTLSSSLYGYLIPTIEVYFSFRKK